MKTTKKPSKSLSLKDKAWIKKHKARFEVYNLLSGKAVVCAFSFGERFIPFHPQLSADTKVGCIRKCQKCIRRYEKVDREQKLENIHQEAYNRKHANDPYVDRKSYGARLCARCGEITYTDSDQVPFYCGSCTWTGTW